MASVGRDYIPPLRGKDLVGKAGPAQAAELSREQIHEACDASLKRLQTSYLDLYQLHWPSRYTPIFAARRYERRHERNSTAIDEQVAAIGELIAAGKIRAWGLSNENAFGVSAFVNAATRLGVPMPITIQVRGISNPVANQPLSDVWPCPSAFSVPIPSPFLPLTMHHLAPSLSLPLTLPLPPRASPHSFPSASRRSFPQCRFRS